MLSARGLLTLSIILSIVYAGVGYIYHLTLAEALSESLALELNVNEDQLRVQIVDALRGDRIRHAVIFAFPGVIMAVLIGFWLRNGKRERNGDRKA